MTRRISSALASSIWTDAFANYVSLVVRMPNLSAAGLTESDSVRGACGCCGADNRSDPQLCHARPAD